MSDQLDLFVPQPDEAIDRGRRHADPEWTSAARSALRHLTSTRLNFTTDDLHALLAHQSAHTHDTRALGSVMRWGERTGICHPTDRFGKSTRPECHSRPVRIWEATRP